MRLPLFERAVLRVEVPEFGLKPGDIVTVVDYVPGPHGREDGCVLEAFNVLGESIAVVSVGESEIEPLSQYEVPSARKLVMSR